MECIQTDNGFEFTNRFSNSKRDLPSLFEAIAAKLGIRHKLIRLYTLQLSDTGMSRYMAEQRLKCRTDPVWPAYRTYKARYARYLKKKMTAAQFGRWSRFAVELRKKVEQGGICLESHVTERKK